MTLQHDNINKATAYYTAMKEKDIASVAQHLHPDVQFSGPLSQMNGKETVLTAIKGFMSFFKTLEIRAKFSSESQAVIVYDVEFPTAIGHMPSVALLTFKEGLIAKIELFFDGRPFDKI
jgi:ketosteroid isomerase-like protein